MTPGRRVDHDAFCRIENWVRVRDARGRPVRHHVTYELSLPDGRILRTRISRPVDTTTHGPSLWRAILRDQLVVSEPEFWACVRDKHLPDRGSPTPAHRENALPAGLVHQLLHVAGVPEAEVRIMTLEQALDAMNAHWSAPPPAG